MKNLLIKLSLIAIMVVACNTASAVFTDSPGTLALWHCDATNWAGATETTPDDNSSGRAAHDLQINAAGEVTMMPGSPYGGSYLAFDVGDHATGWGALDPMPTDYLSIDVSFKASVFPDVGTYKSVLWTGPIRVMLWNNGGTTYLGLLHYNTGAAVATWNFSTKLPALDTWYSVNAEYADSSLDLTFGNDTDGYTTTTVTTGAGLWGAADYVCVGWDPFDGTGQRNYGGDLDEMRIKNIPEPFTFGLIGLLGLLAIRRK